MLKKTKEVFSMGFLDELKGAINEAADTITKVVDKVEKPLTDKATNIAKSASGYTNEAVDFINKTVDKPKIYMIYLC